MIILEYCILDFNACMFNVSVFEVAPEIVFDRNEPQFVLLLEISN